MPRDLASVRLDAHAVSRYAVFFEAWHVGYTNDESGALTGSGLGSWIGLSETAIGGNEDFGTREIRPGLIVPDTVTFAIEDLKTGALRASPLTIQILDPELATLFASEKPFEIVAERIAPGTTALGPSIQVDGGGTTNPRGRHIGIERIGPSGERRTCPAIPFDLVGYDHPVGVGRPPVVISDEPLEFAGRLVTIYRVYADPTAPGLGGELDATSFYTWDECHDAGDLVWVGVMRDAGVVGENEIYSIECHGIDALTRRTLGDTGDFRWIRIDADLVLSSIESYVSIGLTAKGHGQLEMYFDSSALDHQVTAVDGRGELADQITGWIQGAIDGTDTNIVNANGAFATWLEQPDNNTLMNPSAGITAQGVVWIRREPREDPEDFVEGQYPELELVMHEKVWRALGFDPVFQTHLLPHTDLIHVDFYPREAGKELGAPFFGAGEVPCEGYWRGRFTTIELGSQEFTLSAYENNGAPREYYPYHTAEVFSLSPTGGQVLRFNEDPGYVEGQLTAGFYDSSAVNGVQTNRARWWVLRGDRVHIEDDPETEEKIEVTEPKPYRQVISASWVEGTHYGEIGVGAGFAPSIYVDQICNARAFGIPFAPMKVGWSGKPTGQGAIEIAPLNAYHYFISDSPGEEADTLVQQILLSTGACGGWSAPLDAGASITAGPNTHPGAPLFAGDYELADLGLGVPYQLVADPDAWRAAFATVPGGAGGSLNRCRLAYIGAFHAQDALAGLLRPRGLCWSLHGKVFGAFRVGPVSPEEADLTIVEDDLWGEPFDPITARPLQTQRATGQLDGIELSYNLNPETKKHESLLGAPALDPGARRRTGELVEQVKADGLRPPAIVEQVMLHESWATAFSQLWQYDLAGFFERRHYMLEFVLARPKGQDAMPGTSISITNPWPLGPDGVRGIASATGRIVSAEHRLRDGTTRVQAIVFVGGSTAVYGPVVRVRRVSGTAIEFYPDGLGHRGAALDGTGFDESSWSSAGGDIEGTLYQRNGDAYTPVYSGTIASVNLATRTITMSTSVTGWLRDKDHYFVASAYAEQDADSWSLSTFGAIADTDNTIGDAATAADAFMD